MTSHRGLLPLVCSACGSSWFRQTPFASPDPAEGHASFIAVCLCGAAAARLLSGLRSGSVDSALHALLHAREAQRIARQSRPDMGTLAEVSIEPMLALEIARL